MGNFTQTQIENAWATAQIVPNNDKWRKDPCGAWIHRDSYGKTSDGGWEIDHKFPTSKGGTNAPSNLRAMHWANNRSKGDSYPQYTCVVTSSGTKNIQTNAVYSV